MTVYDLSVKNGQGEPQSLSEYRGKVLLIVNTATKCGLTPQYKGLEALYQKYRDRGFEILDFPSNQFLEQAPGTYEEISSFCTLNYGTTFPRFAKLDVNGVQTDPLYVWLKEQAPKDITDEKALAFEAKVGPLSTFHESDAIKWNFGKFLIDREGNVAARYSPAYEPRELEQAIEDLLG